MATTLSPTSASSSPPLSPDLSKEESSPFQITLDRPAIASPFPSPGSAFVPPPKPVVHEFALPPKRGKKNASSSAPASGTTTPNNASTSSIVQNKRGSGTFTIDLDSAALPNGEIPSTGKEKFTKSELLLSSSAQPQPQSQLQSHTQPTSSPATFVSSKNMSTTNNASEDLIHSKISLSPGKDISCGSGRETPTPSNITGHVDGPIHASNPFGNGSATTNVNPRTSISASSTSSKRTSLSSSRPAPPSPALSRNASQSRSGSRRQSRLSLGASPNSSNSNNAGNGTTTPSKRLSTMSTLSATSNPNQNKRLSTLSNISTLPTVPQSQVASAVTPTAPTSNSSPSDQILIRDFAFPSGDRRHTGQGADAPKVIKKMQKKYGPPGVRKPERGRDSTSVSASSSRTSSESGSRRGSGFGFGWGTNAGGWWSGMFAGFGNASRTSRVVDKGEDEDAYTPTANDLSMNFNTSSSSPGISQPSSPSVVPQAISSHANDKYDDYTDDNSINRPLLPGLYKAVFDFTPEGTAEMGLREGDIVRVAGEGGGEGWAVVVRGLVRFTEEGEEVIETDDGTKARTQDSWALVPESYLEVWRLDRNDDEDQLADDEQ